ncbi:TSUP family transporter [Peribacillus asahii]|uniref:TSUP family transporter n=1 Tax=Peribacillus asahii TaxID=228899 RepID=UPI00207A8C15|nr:TSUP family transporter [Peribacillus asahii]USK58015.1 TSUP family transporter [Peribacillus asahii]
MFGDLDISLVIILFIFGFLGAFINSIVGGGGLITLPALLFVGLPPATAIATNKLASTLGNLTSMLAFLRAGKIDLKLLRPIVPLVFMGSMLGAVTVHYMSPDLLKPLMFIMLVVVLIYTIIKKDWGNIEKRRVMTKKRKALFIGGLTALGFYDGFLGPGTGSFIIFFFIIMGFDFIQASGNAKLLNFTSNFAALIMFLSLGTVNYSYGIIMGLSMIIGAFAGAKFALGRGTAYVRIIFILVTSLLILKSGYDFFMGEVDLSQYLGHK